MKITTMAAKVIFYLSMVALIVLRMTFLCQATRYDGDEVLEVIVNDDEQLNEITRITEIFKYQVNIWRPPIKETGAAQIHVEDSVKEQFKQHLTLSNITYRIIIKNLQKQIDKEQESNPKEGLPLPWNSGTKTRRRRGRRSDEASSSPNSIVGKFATYEELSNWLIDLTKTFPNITDLKVIGKTFEGRDILLLKIGDKNRASINPGIWVDAGTHAREWITISSAVYIISQILSDYWNQTEGLSLTGNVDWYIVPLINPDGYVHTYRINGTRLWRKNRSSYNSSYSQVYNMSCRGTDINRNFDFQWKGIGASTEPCYETYCGPWAASENETNAVMNFLSEHDDIIRGYVTIHSYGQLFMVRWAYSLDAPSTPEFNETLKVAEEAVSAINETSGVKYKAGTSPQILYPFTGGSGDWVRANTRIRHAYDVELRDQGQLGFVLPANYVIPVGEEIWEGIKIVATHVLEDYPPVIITTTMPSSSTVDNDAMVNSLSCWMLCFLCLTRVLQWFNFV